jgi:hypothetical protein
VSRKLTKASSEKRSTRIKNAPSSRASQEKKQAKSASQRPESWLKSTERVFEAFGVALPDSLQAASLETSWQTWLNSEGRFACPNWAMGAIYFVERYGASWPIDGESSKRLEELEKLAQEGEAIGLEAAPLVHQLARGELRLKLVIARDDRVLSAAALTSLIDGLECLLDGEGMPHKNYVAVFPQLAACWVRCFSLARRLDIAPRTLPEPRQEAFAQCRWIPLRLAQLSRRDGTAIFSQGNSDAISAELIKEALKLWGDKVDQKNAGSLRYDVIKPTPKPAVDKIARATCGDWSGIGVFRTDAHPDAPYVGVALNEREFLLEIGLNGAPLLGGAMQMTLTRDGHSLSPTGPWEEVCRHQEPEVEYWELERTHDRGVWIQRQIVLACKDRFAYVCDNIVASGAGDLTYRLVTPLAAGVAVLPAAETREITLQRDKSKALVLPLAAEEWQSTPSYFEFRQEGENLRFDGRTRQSRMSIPWIVDLRGSRKQEDATWRQLRVAENLQNLPRDIAVAFRWQIGAQQWMAYRSLAAPSNRTVLGQNLIGDFLLARVFADGKTKTIVEIE